MYNNQTDYLVGIRIAFEMKLTTSTDPPSPTK